MKTRPRLRHRRLLFAALAAALPLTVVVAGAAQGAVNQPTVDAAAVHQAAVNRAAPGAVAATFPYQDPSLTVPARVADLLPRMSLDEKIGQMTQAERAAIPTADVTTYRIGSVLSGGGSAPASNSASGWADMVDGFQRAALATPLGIPMLYGLDAVHGDNNVYGSTIFPHNIGLGATRDPALVQQIGRATAEEVTGAGPQWTFAPCLCVVRNDRWGRSYESFGETPELVSSMATVITGLQGSTLGGGPASILATAKHFIGDGGTTGGDDQGNTQLTEAQLRAIHLPPFQAAVNAGVGSIMVSFSSFNGAKLSGSQYLLTTLLKGELGFKGFLVSDWAAIDQLDGQLGFTAAEVATAINAGLDMIMVPTDYKTFIADLRQDVQNGQIPQSRIDDAVSRILTQKFKLGLFEHPLADRSYANTIGSAAHRSIARQAVRESQVLLKNTNNILPLARSGGKIFVAGKDADDLGNQSGGWTISWQGASGNTIPGTSILAGIRGAVGSAATVTYNRDGTGIDSSYRAAIAVVGETPYAEGAGDKPGSMSLDATDLATLAKLKASGVPVITVLVSGRPLDIAAQLPDWSALLASWLPGSEGAGVSDVLFGDYKPTGKLPVTWMQTASQEPINDGDGQSSLFPYGYGLTYPGGSPSPSPSVSPSRTPSASPTPSRSPSVSPTPSRSVSPTPSRSASPTGPAAGFSCTVTYRVSSQWTGGFGGTVAIAVTGGTVNGWTLRFAFPSSQQVTSAWNATVTQSGTQVTATNLSYNAQLGAVSWGFNGSWSAANPVPTAFTLNGVGCTAG